MTIRTWAEGDVLTAQDLNAAHAAVDDRLIQLETGAGQKSLVVPMIGKWAVSRLVVTGAGSLVTLTGTIATDANTVPAGVSQAIGIIPVGYRPVEMVHGPLSGQILGASLPYTARGSLVVEANGNLSVFTEALTTTLQVSLVFKR